MTTKPIRGIARITGLDPPAIRDKIDYIHSRRLGFAGEREQEFKNLAPADAPKKHPVHRALHSIGRLRVSSRVDDEPRPDSFQVDVEDEARINGDLEQARRSHFRASPQYWREQEFERHPF
ncbi:hypothetical protein [Rubrimonas cliftonensis]|uniref:hypothetical protein n=1 Tax=Rubrimonas cliftonensis TaxID=89524 RepID=UPI001114FC32|nr:hypothetical protein [Rubrimonas cliftonensis]